MIHQCIHCEATTIHPRGTAEHPKCPSCGSHCPAKIVPPLDSTVRLRVANDALAKILKKETGR